MTNIYTKSHLDKVNYFYSEILKESTNYVRQTISENNNSKMK